MLLSFYYTQVFPVSKAVVDVYFGLVPTVRFSFSPPFRRLTSAEPAHEMFRVLITKFNLCYDWLKDQTSRWQRVAKNHEDGVWEGVS